MNFDVPGPEAAWLEAPVSACPNPNPAWQTSMWWYVAGLFREVACLAPPLEVLAHRLRLSIEHGWEDLSEVDVAMVQIRGIHFALYRLNTSLLKDTIVSVLKDTEDDEVAMNVLLTALDIGPDAVTYRGNVRSDEAQ
ncbi:hypothetical protein ACFWWM_34985 [Streptomyces sp. NPDC058682]|uniref:hypothetical protein n=1 Tax=Streptomyces sp. NPDC058682 TaxID=3346596 RepID=UPI00365BBD23